MEDRSKFKIKNIKILRDFVLEITFDDNKVHIIDFSKIKHQGWWKELENLEYFNRVRISKIKHLEWPDGQDYKPEHLYFCRAF